MNILTQVGLAFLSRWAHILSGVTWIGLLWYFNFVQTPTFAELEAPARNANFDKLVPRALWWFRWGALLTLLTGVSILAFQEQLTMDYLKTAPGLSIITGILLAVVMFGNVWGVIWPNQKILIANARGVLAGKEADPAAARAGRKAAVASRTNTWLSIPMLFFMAATSHFAVFKFDTSKGGNRAIYWLVLLVIVGGIEVNALMAPPAGDPRAIALDNHRNTIIAGFALTVILYAAWEILFGM